MNITKKFKCDYKDCKATFSKNSKLVIHLRVHNGERPFICDYPNCKKSYTSSSHLIRHKNVNHKKLKPEPIKCTHDGCDALLANKYSLKKHYNSKHNPKNALPFVCTECAMGFRKKRQLQQHTYIHTGIAPFQCDKCDKRYVTTIEFTKHQKRHRLHTCQCDAKFDTWSAFVAHRKFCQTRLTCKICEKLFKTRANFRKHLIIHTDKYERLVYPCPYQNCKRFYFYKNNLVFHMNIYHKKKTVVSEFKCNYPDCRKILKTKAIFKQHLLRHIRLNVRKIRKVRKDKGSHRRCMADILTNKIAS